MNNGTEHIDFDLMAKCLSGEASTEERARLDAWVGESDVNREEFESMKQLWGMAADEPVPVDVDAAWLKVSEQTNASKIIPIAEEERGSWSRWTGMAAGLALLIAAGVSFWVMNQGPEMLLVESGGHTMALTLPDGSQINLKENSTLSYPEGFTGDLREVTLTGVGYFNIEADKAHPFIVHTQAGDVRVVGTEFEVDARETDKTLSVDVAEGIVEVSSKDEAEKVRVEAGQRAVLDVAKGELKREENSSPAPFFWKDRTIKFKRTELSRVVVTLEDLLEIQIKLSNEELQECEVTATFKNEDAQTILEVIATTLQLDLSHDGDTFTLSGEGC